MTTVSNEHKQNVIAAIAKKKDQLGSFAAVANFCGISAATISLMSADKYETQNNEAWVAVGNSLGVNFSTIASTKQEWVIVETVDLKQIEQAVVDAKNNSFFLAISDLAGIGKTGSLKYLGDKYASQNVFYLRCFDWGKREFLEKLCKSLGIDAGRGYKTPNALLDLVIEFFQNRSLYSPLLIIDEADKLKSSAKRCFIPLFNECEDKLGVIIAGTENLEKEIKTGVRYHSKGYDEIDSRFGRKYIKLMGVKEDECVKICKANGLADEAIAKRLFEECLPVRKLVPVIKVVDGKKTKGQELIRYITDLRRLKRLVQKHLLKPLKN